MPRISSAITMPIDSTFCRYSRGTAKDDMMITNTNRLSTESEYSVIQPAKNSPPYWGPAVKQHAESEEDGEGDVARRSRPCTPCIDGSRGLREIR